MPPPPISDLVLETKIETVFQPDHAETRHIRKVVGRSARHRQQKTEETWRRGRCLGEGSFGTVWLEHCAASRKARAVKQIRKGSSLPTELLYRELETIAKFSHEKYAHCFVRSMGWFENDAHIFIAMEYLKHGDLQHYFAKGKPLPEIEARQIALQLVESLDLLHGSGFAHRDLKPSNIMVFRPGPAWWVKIGDFGISKRMEGTDLRTSRIGTSGYMAPELLHLYPPSDPEVGDEFVYTASVDMWALGEITFRMLTGEAAFPGRKLFDYVVMGAKFPTLPLESAGCSADCAEFISSCMAASPRNRLESAQALEHAWLKNHEFMDDPGYRSDSSIEATEPAPVQQSSDEYSARWSTIHKDSDTIVVDTPEPLASDKPSSTPEPPAQDYSARWSTVRKSSHDAVVDKPIASDEPFPTPQPPVQDFSARWSTVRKDPESQDRSPMYDTNGLPPRDILEKFGIVTPRSSEQVQRPEEQDKVSAAEEDPPKPQLDLKKDVEPIASHSENSQSPRNDLNTATQTAPASEEPIPFSCEVSSCDHTAWKLGKLRRHYQTRHPEEPFPEHYSVLYQELLSLPPGSTITRTRTRPSATNETASPDKVEQQTGRFYCHEGPCISRGDFYHTKNYLYDHHRAKHATIPLPQTFEPPLPLPVEIGDFICLEDNCPTRQMFSTLGDLSKHYQKRHRGSAVPARVVLVAKELFMCEQPGCGYQKDKWNFGSLNALRKHYQDLHPKAKVKVIPSGYEPTPRTWQCEEKGCGKAGHNFGSRAALEQHTRHVHETAGRTSTPKVDVADQNSGRKVSYSCEEPVCWSRGTQFPSLDALNQHARDWHPSKAEVPTPNPEAVVAVPGQAGVLNACPRIGCTYNKIGFRSQAALNRHILDTGHRASRFASIINSLRMK